MTYGFSGILGGAVSQSSATSSGVSPYAALTRSLAAFCHGLAQRLAQRLLNHIFHDIIWRIITATGLALSTGRLQINRPAIL
ncbi:MAG TPA: hypothetical protein VGD98_26765 [Ktedonobacteraceae bacterium]